MGRTTKSTTTAATAAKHAINVRVSARALIVSGAATADATPATLNVAASEAGPAATMEETDAAAQPPVQLTYRPLTPSTGTTAVTPKAARNCTGRPPSASSATTTSPRQGGAGSPSHPVKPKLKVPGTMLLNLAHNNCFQPLLSISTCAATPRKKSRPRYEPPSQKPRCGGQANVTLATTR